MALEPPAGEGMERLRAIAAQLREHCPWDREQTLESAKGLAAEEGAELQAAIERQDWANLCEEVGDVLFNLLLVTRIAEDRGLFTWDDVVAGEAAKMIRRHPHVYGAAEAVDSDSAVARFNEAKAAERREAAGGDGIDK